MDSNDVTIIIKTGSINGMQIEEEIDIFAREVKTLAKEILCNSTLEIDITKHRIIR